MTTSSFQFGFSPPEDPRVKAERLEKQLEAIRSNGKHIGMLVQRTGSRGVVLMGTNMIETNLAAAPDARPGDGVFMGDKGNVVGEAGPVGIGAVGTYVKRVSANTACVRHGSQERVVFLKEGLDPEPGERVRFDPSGSILLESLGPDDDDAGRFNVELDFDVAWDDVGGQVAAKSALRESIEDPLLHGELYKGYGAKPAKGILLYGPPGTGKTLLARAAATSLKGFTGAGGFFAVKGPEVIDKFVGESEAAVRALFAAARDHAKKKGTTAVVFIDEADALLGSRSNNQFNGMEKTIVPAFLTEMDGLSQKSGVLVILATNRSDMLDPAVVRDGRVDRRVEVGRPTREECVELFKVHLCKIPTSSEPENFDFPLWCADRLFTHGDPVTRIATGPRKSVDVFVRDLASGALVAGVVGRAVKNAIRRDKESRAKKPSGVNRGDVGEAIHASAEELRGTDLRSVVVEKMGVL